MSLWFIVFIASGAGMILLLTLKVLQEKMGLMLFWPNQREIVEKALSKRQTKVVEFLNSFSKRNFYIFLHFVLTKIRRIFSRIQSWLDQKSARLVGLITGKQRLTMNGKASNFLYDIRSFKDRFRRH